MSKMSNQDNNIELYKSYDEISGESLALDARCSIASLCSTIDAMPTTPSYTPFLSRMGSIGVMNVKGMLFKDKGTVPGSIIDYNCIESGIETLNGDPDVKAIILLFDCPGGTVKGLRRAFNAINSSGKPVFSYVEDGQCLSAAYWLACATRQIYADQYSEIGSIGVRKAHIERSKQLQMSGVTVREFAKGDKKLFKSETRPLSEEAAQAYEKDIEQLSDEFFTIVKQSREGINEEVFESGVYYGREAFEVGLIDGFFDNTESILEFLGTIVENYE